MDTETVCFGPNVLASGLLGRPQVPIGEKATTVRLGYGQAIWFCNDRVEKW